MPPTAAAAVRRNAPHALVGVGLVVYGCAVLFARDRPRWIAAASALFGATLLLDGAVVWYRLSKGGADDVLAGPRPGPDLGRSSSGGESLQESYDRVRSAKLTKQVVRAPSLEDRIAILRKLAREGSESVEVREKALAVLSRTCGSGRDRRWCVPEKGWESEVEAVFNAFRDPKSPIGVRYVRDAISIDQYTNVAKTIRTKSGDCDDQASALAAILMSVGYSCRFKPMSAKGAGGSASHILISCGVPPGPPERVKKWISLDPTVNKPAGWQPGPEVVEKWWEFDI